MVHKETQSSQREYVVLNLFFPFHARFLHFKCFWKDRLNESSNESDFVSGEAVLIYGSLTVATAGSGLGGMTFSLATNAMIQSLGVGWAFRILGILSFTVNSVCALLMKDRNKAIGSSQLAFDVRFFKKIEFWLTLGWGFFSMLGYIVLLFSLPNYALSVSFRTGVSEAATPESTP